jgi:hypothetical protein
METDRDLAAFRAALLELLHQPLTPGEILARLRSDAAFKPYAAYVEKMDVRSIEVAALLVKKWGKISAAK